MGLGKTGASCEDQHDSGIGSCGLASFVKILKTVVGNHQLAQSLEQISDVDVLFRNREGKIEKPFCREIFKSLPLLGRNCFHTAASDLRSKSCG